MEIINKRPVPIYVQECPECGSTFTFRKVEVCCNMIYCPVCGISQWASFQKIKDERREEE